MQPWSTTRKLITKKLERKMTKLNIPDHNLYLEIEHKVIDYLNDDNYQTFSEFMLDLVTEYELMGIPIDEDFIEILLELLDLLVERTSQWQESETVESD